MKYRFLFFLIFFLTLFSCAGQRKQVIKVPIGYGHRLFSLGLYEEAAFHYRMILQRDSLSSEEKAKVLNNLAVIHEMKEEYLKAREMYREALETDSNVEIYENYKRFMGGL